MTYTGLQLPDVARNTRGTSVGLIWKLLGRGMIRVGLKSKRDFGNTKTDVESDTEDIGLPQLC